MTNAIRTFSVASAMALSLAACGQEKSETPQDDETNGAAIGAVTSTLLGGESSANVGDPEKGKRRFVAMGCVVCHSVQGIGGRAAPPLDAMEFRGKEDPVDFAARMWRGAPIMVELQRLEIGYQIDLSGEDIRHLAAFANDKATQENFTMDDVPEGLRDLFLDQIYMETDLEDRYRGEEWTDFNAPN